MKWLGHDIRVVYDPKAPPGTIYLIPKGPPMTPEQKEAMRIGRQQHATVSAYLEAISGQRRRGPRRTIERVASDLATVKQQLVTNELSPIERLDAVQKSLNLEAELEDLQQGADLDALTDEFVKVAKDYSQRKGLSYVAWRQVGVEPAVLKRAGITRST